MKSERNLIKLVKQHAKAIKTFKRGQQLDYDIIMKQRQEINELKQQLNK